MNYMHENAKPFKYTGNKTGCLLVHGFTACPAQMRLLGDHLKGLGYTVKGVQLQGHGTTIEDMESSTWKDWVDSAEEGLKELMSECDNVYLIGLSMGANISLLLSSKYEVDGIVSMAAPIKITNKKAKYAPILKYFRKYKHKKFDDIPRGMEDFFIAYGKTPVASVPHLLKIMRKSRRRLRKITKPILIIQSKSDNTVRYESGEILLNKVKSNFKKLVYLKDSGHIITADCEKEKVFKEIEEFIDQVNSSK